MASQGILIPDVEEQVGHSTITTTVDQYSYPWDDSRTRIAATMEAVISGGSKKDPDPLAQIPDIRGIARAPR